MHKKNMAIDLMIKDILILSNSHFNFTEAIFKPEEYIKLDDGILHTIEMFSRNPNNHRDLLKASQMVKDLQYRKIYKFVGEILINSEFTSKIRLEDILCCENPRDDFYLTSEDMELVSYSIDYGNSDRDPYSHIYFYKNENPDEYFTVPSKKISLAVPNVFKESYLFLYCKVSQKLERAKNVFAAFIKKVNIQQTKENEEQNYYTPVKSNKINEYLSNKTYRKDSEKLQSELCSNLNVKFNKIN